ncbi:MAG: EAL domain-containing protein, partial [Firmicutes bacterium]|nr:EAL domain-containing protein [Bacillota bacterium]
MKEIKIIYQPVCDLDSGNIKGFEALARGPDGFLHSPNNLFRVAAREGFLCMAEMLCFKLAVENASSLPGLIFYNFSPSTVINQLDEIINQLRCAPNKAVIELIEYALPENKRIELVNALCELQAAGIKVALDDVGNGDRDLSDICEIPADFMKIDRRLVRGLTRRRNGKAPRYQITLHAMVKLARMLSMQVIAEEAQHQGR